MVPLIKDDYCLHCSSDHYRKLMQLVFERFPFDWSEMLRKKLVLMILFGQKTEYDELKFVPASFAPLITTLPLSELPEEFQRTNQETKVRVIAAVAEKESAHVVQTGYVSPVKPRKK